MIQNNLGNAIGYPNGLVNWGQGFSQGGNPYAPQISQTNTIFENLRWYLISNFRQPLSQAYVELGLIQTVVDIPVDDALRGGIEINSKQLDENQIEEIQISLDRDDDLNTVGQSAKWNRLFGGAGTMIIVEDQDYEEPLDIESISKGTIVEFRAVDMWELFNESQNAEQYDMETQTEESEFYNYYGRRVHKSRVMKMKGLIAPSFIRPRLRGWGFSVVEILIRSINQYLKATDLAFACLDEFKVDIYKIKNLVNTLMMPDGGAAIANRLQMANWQKNYQNALVMDSEDDWDHKQLSFAGLAETMDGIRKQVAADMRMPITKLFGSSDSKGGLGSADQNDMENYNSMVESQIRNKIKYDILRMLEIKCQVLFGFIPDDLQIDFKPLRVLSALDEETVKTSKFARLMQASQLGKIDDKLFIEACNKDDLLGVLISTDALSESDEIADGDGVKEGEDNSDGDSLNRSDEKELSLTVSLQKPDKALANENPAIPDPSDDGFKYDPDFDLISYQAVGADDWIDQNEMSHFDEPTEATLWEQSKAASMFYLKTDNLKYRVWWYRRMGGTFKSSREDRSTGYDANLDVMAYKRAGGNDWIDQNEMTHFEHPQDLVLWDRTAKISMKYLKLDNLKYRIWAYRKMGGSFGVEPVKKKSLINRIFQRGN